MKAYEHLGPEDKIRALEQDVKTKEMQRDLLFRSASAAKSEARKAWDAMAHYKAEYYREANRSMRLWQHMLKCETCAPTWNEPKDVGAGIDTTLFL